MKITTIVIGFILLAFSVFLFFQRGGLIFGVIVLVGSALSFSSGFSVYFTKNRITRIRKTAYDGIVQNGLQRIEKGSFHADKEIFVKRMETVQDILADQELMPKFGLDAVYLEYTSEEKARKVAEIINSRGLKTDIIQDRMNWEIKLEM
jgi:flagellar biosynthesis component FlhA